jgi:hypothetical protein
MLASFATLTGQKLPTDAAPDSFDVMAALLGDAGARGRDQLVMQAGSGALAIRQGPWKLIPASGAAGGKGKKKGKAGAAGGGDALFNLAEDLSETNNLAAKYPDRVKELAALLEKVTTQGRSR